MIATPYASGFDHFFIADEVQFKFDRCLRFLQETVSLLYKLQDVYFLSITKDASLHRYRIFLLLALGILWDLLSTFWLVIQAVPTLYCLLGATDLVCLKSFDCLYTVDQDQGMLCKEVEMY